MTSHKLRTFLVLHSLFFILLFISCTTDAYDKGDGEFSLMTAEMVDAHVDSDKHVDYVDTDEGVRLTSKAPFTMKWISKGDTIYRALFYYNKEEGRQAEAVSLTQVALLRPKAAADLEQQVKTDPLYLESSWASKTRKYVNLRLRLLTGSTDDDEAKHTLGLVSDTTMVNPDGSKTAYCRLYHDQGGRPAYYSQVVYASIPVEALAADSLVLTINTYNQAATVAFKVKN